jgi:hypothetical protein
LNDAARLTLRSTLMRINFATTQDAQFWDKFERLRAEQ